MEDALNPLDEADQPIRANKQFILGLAVSGILHLICAAVLLGIPGGAEPARRSVTYVDLSSVPAPKPAALPAPEATREQEPQLPETPPVPSEARPEEPKPAAEQPVAAPPQEAVAERSASPLGMGLTKGYFKSLGDGETLRPDIKEYYQGMLQGINEKWWLEQRDQKVRAIMVNLTVARNGDIVASAIMESSGNFIYDRAVQKSLESAGPLPPLPASFRGEFFEAPIRLVPPLDLLAW